MPNNQFGFMKAQDVFIVGKTGASVDDAIRCEHDQGAIFIALYGRHYDRPQSPQERLDTFVPRCVLTALVGAVQAQIRFDEGEAAAEEFIKETAEHAAASFAALQDMQARKRLCCEAGFHTDGSEHTCRRNGAGQ